MPIPFEGLGSLAVEALTGGASRALPYIIHGVYSGLSANAIGNALRQAGLGIRRANLLAAVAEIRSGYVGAAYQRSLGPDVLPNPSVFRSAQGFLDRNFSYIVAVHGTHMATGLPVTEHITITSDSVLSNDEIAQYAEEIINAASAAYQLAMDDHEVLAVLTDPRILF